MSECYFTPDPVTVEILKTQILYNCTSMLDPCAGDGAIIRSVRKWGFDWHTTAVEIEQEYQEDLYVAKADRVIMGDFLSPQTNVGKFDALITNPPYSLIEQFIEKGHACLHEGGKMAMLLRLAHLVGVQRGYFLLKYRPSAIHLLCNRPIFTGTGSDIGGYAWVVWDNPITTVDTTTHWIQRNPEKVDGRINNGGKKKIYTSKTGYRCTTKGFQSRPRGSTIERFREDRDARSN